MLCEEKMSYAAYLEIIKSTAMRLELGVYVICHPYFKH